MLRSEEPCFLVVRRRKQRIIVGNSMSDCRCIPSKWSDDGVRDVADAASRIVTGDAVRKVCLCGVSAGGLVVLIELLSSRGSSASLQ